MKLITSIITICLVISLSGCLNNTPFNKKNTHEKIITAPSKKVKTNKIKSSSSSRKLAGLSIIYGNELLLDRHDKEYMISNSQETLNKGKIGETSRWRNPDSGNYGSFKVTSDIQLEGKNECRNFSQIIVISGKTRQISGKACHEADGSWFTY